MRRVSQVIRWKNTRGDRKCISRASFPRNRSEAIRVVDVIKRLVACIMQVPDIFIYSTPSLLHCCMTNSNRLTGFRILICKRSFDTLVLVEHPPKDRNQFFFRRDRCTRQSKKFTILNKNLIQVNYNVERIAGTDINHTSVSVIC